MLCKKIDINFKKGNYSFLKLTKNLYNLHVLIENIDKCS